MYSRCRESGAPSCVERLWDSPTSRRGVTLTMGVKTLTCGDRGMTMPALFLGKDSSSSSSCDGNHAVQGLFVPDDGSCSFELHGYQLPSLFLHVPIVTGRKHGGSNSKSAFDHTPEKKEATA